jgi:hypothetical protein
MQGIVIREAGVMACRRIAGEEAQHPAFIKGYDEAARIFLYPAIFIGKDKGMLIDVIAVVKGKGSIDGQEPGQQIIIVISFEEIMTALRTDVQRKSKDAGDVMMFQDEAVDPRPGDLQMPSAFRVGGIQHQVVHIFCSSHKTGGMDAFQSHIDPRYTCTRPGIGHLAGELKG